MLKKYIFISIFTVSIQISASHNQLTILHACCNSTQTRPCYTSRPTPTFAEKIERNPIVQAKIINKTYTFVSTQKFIPIAQQISYDELNSENNKENSYYESCLNCCFEYFIKISKRHQEVTERSMLLNNIPFR